MKTGKVRDMNMNDFRITIRDVAYIYIQYIIKLFTIKLSSLLFEHTSYIHTLYFQYIECLEFCQSYSKFYSLTRYIILSIFSYEIILQTCNKFIESIELVYHCLSKNKEGTYRYTVEKKKEKNKRFGSNFLLNK